jgi:hypothetical protein
MHPKIHSRPASEKRPVGNVKPLLLHDVTNPVASVRSAVRQRLAVPRSALGGASHARHHVSRRTQS